jgi:hypothetical protein
LRLLSTKVLLLITLLSGVASTACQSGGVGDPCVPEDEYATTFGGYSETEVNVESRSFQCETRVCLVANFRGRVSCPYGQLASTSDPTVADPSISGPDRCYLPGTKQADQNLIKVPVQSQLPQRSPDKAVYCSCRCAGPDPSAQYCDCPSGYECKKLVDAYGTSGGAQLAGSYCIKGGTGVDDPTQYASNPGCALTGVTHSARPNGCGLDEHPAGI